MPKLTQRERIDSQLFEFPLSNTFEQRPHSHAVAVAEYNNECNSVNEARPSSPPAQQLNQLFLGILVRIKGLHYSRISLCMQRTG